MPKRNIGLKGRKQRHRGCGMSAKKWAAAGNNETFFVANADLGRSAAMANFHSGENRPSQEEIAPGGGDV
jgi:hypothetical protein